MKFLENLNCGKVLKKKNADTDKKADKKVSCNSQIGEGIVSNLGTALSSWGDFVIGDANDKGYFPLSSPSHADIPVYVLIVDTDDKNLGSIMLDNTPFSSGVRDVDGLSQWFQKRANNYDRFSKRFDETLPNMTSLFEELANLNGVEVVGVDDGDEEELNAASERMTKQERELWEEEHKGKERTTEEKENIRKKWEELDQEDLGPIMNEDQKAKAAYVFRESLNGALEGACEDNGMPYSLLPVPEPKRNKQGEIISIPLNVRNAPSPGPGYHWANLSNSKVDNRLKTSLHYKSKSDPSVDPDVFKCSLRCNFSKQPYVWIFNPDDNKERALSNDAKRSTHLKNDLYYEEHEFHAEDLSDKSLRKVGYEISGFVYEVIDAYIDAPPDRVYAALWADGRIKMNMIKGLSKKGIENLVQTGLDLKEHGVEGKVLTGDTVLQERPELWNSMLHLKSPSGQTRAVTNGQAVWSAAEKAIKADKSLNSEEKDKALADAIRAIVKEGLMPQERAQQLIPNKAKRASEQEPIKYKGSGVVKTGVDEWIEKVKNGTYRPGQVYQQNNDTLKPMIEQKLITPHDAYQLNPRILMWMLREHHIGRKEAMELDKHVRDHFKQDARRKGKDPAAEWESLDASKKLNCTDKNFPEVYYYEDDYGMASTKAIEAELVSRYPGYDINVTKSGDLFKVSIYANSPEAEASLSEDLHDEVNAFLGDTFSLFPRDDASSGLGLDDDAFGGEDPFAEENTGRVDDLGRKWNKDATFQGKEAGWEDIYNTVLKRERAIRGNSSVDMDSALIDVGDISIGSNNATEPLNSDFWTDSDENGNFELETEDELDLGKREATPEINSEYTDAELAYLDSLDEGSEELASSTELDDMYDDYVKQNQEEDEFWYPDMDEEDDWDPWDDVMRDRASEVGAKSRL